MDCRLTVCAIFLLGSLVSVCETALAGGTAVGGNIERNTTWTRDDSPYLLLTSATVTAGATLIIEPGVVVIASNNTVINVGSAGGAGTLIARGTAKDPILFTSADLTPAPGNWQGIAFADQAVDAVVAAGDYVSGSIMEHCIVEYAGSGTVSMGAVTCNISVPMFIACEIRHASRSGIRANLSGSIVLRVLNCNLHHNTHGPGQSGGGLYISGGTGHIITGNHIHDNTALGAGGLYVSYTIAGSNAMIADNLVENNSALLTTVGGGAGFVGPNITVTGNTFRSNVAGGGVGGVFCGNANNLLFHNNTVTLNVAMNDYVGGLDVGGQGGTITGNTVTNNTSRFSAGGIRVSTSSVSVTNNIIANNTVTSPTHTAGGILHMGSGTASYQGNTITGNSAGYGGGIHINSNFVTLTGNHVSNNTASQYGGGVLCGGFLPGTFNHTFVSNSIVNNTAGSTGGGIHSNASALNLAGTKDVYNTIAGNNAVTGDAIFNNHANNVAAAHVCWGSGDADDINAWIHDFNDDASKGVVAYAPFSIQCISMPGDTNGDNVVNIDDLLTIVGTWGPCPSPPASCDGDIHPTVSGNGLVNIDDLLQVIGNWTSS
jgi:hypothetical protein